MRLGADAARARAARVSSASPGSAAGARDLFAFLRSPYSGLAALARRLRRGPAARPRRSTRPSASRRRRRSCARRRSPRSASCAPRDPIDGVRALIRSMLRSRVRAPRRRPPARRRGSTCARTTRRCGCSTSSRLFAGSAGDGDARGRRRRARARRGRGSSRRRARAASPSLDLLRARTRRFEVVFVLGLEEGRCRGAARTSPFLDDDTRRELGARLERPDQVSRDRYLFYTACTRATRRLYLVREAATDDGSAARAEPVLGRGRGALRRRRRRARDAPPSAVGAHVAARGGADRARAAARARAARGRRRRTARRRSPTRTAGSGG